jgi:GntR family transcriptional regulator/MocR family aminotransferase
LVESRAASGFFATPDVPSATVQPVFAQSGFGGTPAAPREPVAAATARSSPVPSSPSVRRRANGSRERNFTDFIPGRPNVDAFPVKLWRRMLLGRLSYGGAKGLSEHGDPAGLPALRAAIAEHVSMSRAVRADPAQIIVVGGIQEGLTLAARVLMSPGTTVVTEDPCHEGATLAFEAAGARLHGLPVDEDGLVTAQLPETGDAALVYVTPAHQYPTGHTLSPGRRGELISWARRRGGMILEDDYDSEFQYDGSPLQALAGTAPDCTVYLATFSTTLGAGLRLGFMIVPPALVEAVRSAKSLLNHGNAWLEQAALADFMRSGGYRAHVTRCRAQYKESRDALLASMRRYFGKVEVSGEAAGLHVFWRLPAGVPEAARLQELARGQRVGVYPLAAAGARELAPSPLGKRSLLLGYAGLRPEQIDQGMARLSDAVDDTLDSHHEFLGELMLDGPVPSRPRPSRAPRHPDSLRLHRHSALRTVAAARAVAPNPDTKPEAPMPIVRAIYRYPIKGLSPQHLRGVTLTEGKPFPFDRVFALTRPGVPIDVNEPRWAKKGLFLMLMLEEALASVRTELDVETLRLTVSSAGETVLVANLGSQDGRDAVSRFFHGRVPGLQAAPTLVHSRDGHFMDKPDSVMSCINLATVRSLEAEWGYPINPLRFRANFYIDCARPWEEFDWIGSDVMLGDVLFRVDRRNGRCGAVNVNPATGARDLDLPGALRSRFGHKDLGVYLIARKSGKVVVGDHVAVPELGEPRTDAPAAFVPPLPGQASFICRGCYYVYDERKGAPGLAPGTSFETIGSEWRCPDCGTEKATFRVYAAASL